MKKTEKTSTALVLSLSSNRAESALHPTYDLYFYLEIYERQLNKLQANHLRRNGLYSLRGDRVFPPNIFLLAN